MTASSAELRGESLHAGSAAGTVVRLEAPLSFWGGIDEGGQIIDPRHPQRGRSVTGRILAMSAGRGSSSSSSVLAELLRTGRGPSAIVMAERDTIVTLGAIVAAELYEIAIPVVVLEPADFARLTDGDTIEVSTEQTVATIRWNDRP